MVVCELTESIDCSSVESMAYDHLHNYAEVLFAVLLNSTLPPDFGERFFDRGFLNTGIELDVVDVFICNERKLDVVLRVFAAAVIPSAEQVEEILGIFPIREDEADDFVCFGGERPKRYVDHC